MLEKAVKLGTKMSGGEKLGDWFLVKKLIRGIRRMPPGSQRTCPGSRERAWSSLLRRAVEAASRKAVLTVRSCSEADPAGSKGGPASLWSTVARSQEGMSF